VSTAAETQEAYHRGIPTVRFDLVKELFIALAGSGLVIIVLALLMSSPDDPSVTIQQWSQQDPVDFVTTATAELAGTSFSATYGPPYTDATDAVQAVGPFAPQAWFGNAVHLDTAQEFVLGPLGMAASGNPELTAALATYKAADAATQQAWLTAYTDALGSATAADGQVTVAAGDYGPVPVLMTNLLAIGHTGGLDGLVLSGGSFYQTNYTAPLLFLGDGEYFPGLGESQHMLGDQWGMMNETGSYPGQAWLWLFSMWYQVPPFNTAPNADLLVVMLMGVLTLGLILVPFIPILRDIPRWIPIHRLIWRDYYRWRRTHQGPPAG
jgi:hypothetical protein